MGRSENSLENKVAEPYDLGGQEHESHDQLWGREIRMGFEQQTRVTERQKFNSKDPTCQGLMRQDMQRAPCQAGPIR